MRAPYIFLYKPRQGTLRIPEPRRLKDREYRNLQGILPDLMLYCSHPPGQPPNSLDGYRNLGELKALAQRNISVEERSRRIQLDLDQNAKDLGARDSRNTVHVEMKSRGKAAYRICFALYFLLMT